MDEWSMRRAEQIAEAHGRELGRTLADARAAALACVDAEGMAETTTRARALQTAIAEYRRARRDWLADLRHPVIEELEIARGSSVREQLRRRCDDAALMAYEEGVSWRDR